MAGLDPKTGIYTYADGSTYQNPHNYGTAANPQWSLNNAQINSMLGDQGAAINAANGWDATPSWQLGGGGTSAPAPSAQGGASFGGGAQAGSSSQTGGSTSMTGQNPYLQQMGDALTSTMTNNWQRNVQPQIASSAMATGGYGGSRQGVIEANSANDLNQGIGSALAGLYGNGYNTSLQYDLGRRNNDLGYFGAANSYNLGMGNLGLGYAGLDRQIANDNMSWGQQGYNNNMGLWGQMVNNNNTGINAATGIHNTPINYWQQFGNQYNSIGQGYGTQTSSGGGGNPVMGALGGAQLGSQVAGWWNGGGSGNATTATGYGNGTMTDLQGYGVF